MNSEFRRDRRDAYFLGAKGSCNDLNPYGMWRKVERQHGRSVWIPLALIVIVALVIVRVFVDFI